MNIGIICILHTRGQLACKIASSKAFLCKVVTFTCRGGAQVKVDHQSKASAMLSNVFSVRYSCNKAHLTFRRLKSGIHRKVHVHGSNRQRQQEFRVYHAIPCNPNANSAAGTAIAACNKPESRP